MNSESCKTPVDQNMKQKHQLDNTKINETETPVNHHENISLQSAFEQKYQQIIVFAHCCGQAAVNIYYAHVAASCSNSSSDGCSNDNKHVVEVAVVVVEVVIVNSSGVSQVVVAFVL